MIVRGALERCNTIPFLPTTDVLERNLNVSKVIRHHLHIHWTPVVPHALQAVMRKGYVRRIHEILRQKVGRVGQFPHEVLLPGGRVISEVRMLLLRQQRSGEGLPVHGGGEEGEYEVAGEVNGVSRDVPPPGGHGFDRPSLLELGEGRQCPICVELPPVVRALDASRRFVDPPLAEGGEAVGAHVGLDGPLNGDVLRPTTAQEFAQTTLPLALRILGRRFVPDDQVQPHGFDPLRAEAGEGRRGPYRDPRPQLRSAVIVLLGLRGGVLPNDVAGRDSVRDDRG
mmetsp:Transcript_54194/g.162265  ORF Transcript_54194/g.162265 Transcript_54194/m.162265 type:complete len:283 (+) Transcript_54194:1163-2011(+)